MRPSNATLQAYLESNESRDGVYADCYTFELTGGDDAPWYRLFYTTAQRNLTLPQYGTGDMVTFRADRVDITGLRFRTKIGLEVTEQTVAMTPFDDDVTVQGVPFLQAIKEGLFDGAILCRDRYFFRRWGEAPVGGEGVPLVRARVSTFESIGRTQASLKAKGLPVLLNIGMPRHFHQPSCIWTLFDDGCGVAKPSFTAAGAVESGATRTFIPWAAGSSSVYSLGTVFFENMGDVGTRRNIKYADASGLTLSYPLRAAPAVTELFSASQGCNRTEARCDVLRGRFRGYRYIPEPEKAL